MWNRAYTMSMISRGARHQIGISIALVTVIPLLVVTYLIVGPGLYDPQNLLPSVLIFSLLGVSILLGYVTLCIYPLNVARLRRYLEDIVDGQAPDKVHLLQGMNDVHAIERSLNVIVTQFNDQLRRLEEEIDNRKRAESFKDDFISTVSHELRTPLAISKEGISLVLDGIAGELNEKQHKLLATSERNVDRLARIINDLLDISKIEAGMLDIEKKQTDLVTVLEQTVAGMRTLAEKKGLTMALDVPPEAIDVYIDPDRMVQVVTNLLSNAIKFTEQGGVFTSCRANEGKVVCRVCDTGRGMSEADLPHVFEKFRQFGRTHGAGDRGTGLGLAIVRNIIELHGGAIEVASELDKGTTVTFHLPLYTPEKELLEKINAKLVSAAGGDEVLTLVLLNMEAVTPRPVPEWDAMYRAFYEAFATATAVMRDSDVMMSREDHQVIFLGAMRPESREVVANRWRNLVRESFTELHPELKIRIRHGLATFPEEGKDAEALLACADNKIVLARQEDALHKGETQDATEDDSRGG